MAYNSIPTFSDDSTLGYGWLYAPLEVSVHSILCAIPGRCYLAEDADGGCPAVKRKRSPSTVEVHTWTMTRAVGSRVTQLCCGRSRAGWVTTGLFKLSKWKVL